MTGRKLALITGISGQDGSYLAELLLEKGYEVHGFTRPVGEAVPAEEAERVEALSASAKLHAIPLLEPAEVRAAVGAIRPAECYHLAARSFVSYRPEDEASTLAVNLGGTHSVLAALREAAPGCRFCFAASSEVFGQPDSSPQDEGTPVRPRSIYGITKAAGLELTRYYRRVHGMHAGAAILYNHASPRHGPEFVTRKITMGVAKILAGEARELRLGNLDARRDWGHARDYVRAMWLMLAQPEPDDYVIATGETHSVRQFVDAAFSLAGMDYRQFVVVDKELHRQAEQVELRGDARKAHAALGWAPSARFEELVGEMVRIECVRLNIKLPR
jgi:GDPmannose 4,6-dehydratase